MRITIYFEMNKPVTFPIQYNHMLQGFIYNHISEELADFLHDKGFQDKEGGRTFKLFTFSRLNAGRFQIDRVKKTITFSESLSLTISSPWEEFMRQFAETMVVKGLVQLGSYQLLVSSIKVHLKPEITDRLMIKMLSPITVYSTVTKGDGGKLTYYYHPSEKDFRRLVVENLFKKYRAFHQAEPSCNEFTLTPLRVGTKDERIIIFNDTVIKGWMGKYQLDAPSSLIEFAYDAGLGSRNSQGFGLFEALVPINV